MSVPVYRQATTANNSVAYSTARTLTFPGAVLASSTIVVCGVVGFEGNTGTFASVTASVTMTGATFSRQAEQTMPLGPDLGVMVWTAANVTAGATVVTVTPGNLTTGNYCGLIAFEVTGLATTPWEGYTGNSSYAVTTLALGPTPATGSITQADTMSVFVTAVNVGGIETLDQGWALPTGWTTVTAQGTPTGAQKPFQVAYKTQTAQTAVSVNTSSTRADLYGRAGILFLLRGNVGTTPAPPPPPPGPAPAPPPPAPAQAVKVSGTQAEVKALTGVKVQVYKLPTTETITGTYLFSDAAAAFSGTLESGDAVMYIAVPSPMPSGQTVTTGDNVIVVGQTADGVGGFRGGVAAVVVLA